MRHLIIGQGNLGKDILHQIRMRNQDVMVPMRNTKLSEVPSDFDFVWCTAGAGGPLAPIDDKVKQVETHILLTADIIRRFPKAKKVFFSSHYLNHDPEGAYSWYAKTKSMMEALAVENGALVFRVGSLYGEHLPWKTFPGKMIRAVKWHPPDDLPNNRVSPSPTPWVAQMAMDHRDLPASVQVISPAGSVSVADWGNRIAEAIGSARRFKGKRTDSDYPADSTLKHTSYLSDMRMGGLPTWEQLWECNGVGLVKRLSRV